MSTPAAPKVIPTEKECSDLTDPSRLNATMKKCMTDSKKVIDQLRIRINRKLDYLEDDIDRN